MSNKKYAVFTIDVESFTDTECVSTSKTKVDIDLLDGFDEYIKILDKHNIKSTLFTVGNLAPKISGKIRKYINDGHRLALHSFEHIAPMMVDAERFREKTEKAKRSLDKLFSTEIIGFRAPCFSLDKERLEILRELGFKYDSSHLGFPKARHTVNLDLSDFTQLNEGIFHKNGFYEYGISKQNVFGKPFPVSGGGYVRLSNWSFIKSLIRQYIQSHDYYVFYLHPFELTTRKVPLLRDLKAYDKYYLKYGINSYGRKIEQIIGMLKRNGYKFVTFEELTDILNEQQ